MNFQKINPVPNRKALIDTAFSRARVKSRSEDLTGNWLQIIRKKEILKMDTVQESIVARLDQILKSFPELDALPSFYQQLLRLTIDYRGFKESFGAMGWALQKIKYFHREYVQKVKLEKIPS